MDLKELADELDELREQQELCGDYDNDRLKELEELEHTLGDLHLASKNYDLIHEKDFKDRMQDMAEECGWVDDKSPLSNYIDWDSFAEDSKSDYSVVEFEGDTYYYQDC